MSSWNGCRLNWLPRWEMRSCLLLCTSEHFHLLSSSPPALAVFDPITISIWRDGRIWLPHIACVDEPVHRSAGSLDSRMSSPREIINLRLLRTTDYVDRFNQLHVRHLLLFSMGQFLSLSLCHTSSTFVHWPSLTAVYCAYVKQMRLPSTGWQHMALSTR